MKPRLRNRLLYRCSKCGGAGHNRARCDKVPKKRYPTDERGFADIDAIFAGVMGALRPTPDELAASSRYSRLAGGQGYVSIAAQDGVSARAVRKSIKRFARAAGLAVPAMRPPPPPGLLIREAMARLLNVHGSTLMGWADKGLVPCTIQGGRQLFVADEVRNALATLGWSGGRLHDPNSDRGQVARARASDPPGTRTCSKCRLCLPLDDYPPSTRKKNSGWICRLCKQAYTRASDVRRRRKIRSTQVEPVRIALVAARDGWRCGICGNRVSRENWSMDHVIPISQGGSHTYGNVVLAHRDCNTKRGAGRLPVQAPLFALPPPMART